MFVIFIDMSLITVSIFKFRHQSVIVRQVKPIATDLAGVEACLAVRPVYLEKLRWWLGSAVLERGQIEGINRRGLRELILHAGRMSKLVCQCQSCFSPPASVTTHAILEISFKENHVSDLSDWASVFIRITTKVQGVFQIGAIKKILQDKNPSAKVTPKVLKQHFDQNLQVKSGEAATEHYISTTLALGQAFFSVPKLKVPRLQMSCQWLVVVHHVIFFIDHWLIFDDAWQ